ncbi:hypothetical protein [Argonema galeatum]|uniref:hypothetical protein n=1 Tax=Argonema galeatum TaxID=2942762 RepID=UPI0020118384|nr:hypothetical protein [Argonema galeatum]MCL1464401.1 hypothetical protein [Argonema galeatum A003/A1]
MSNDNKPQNNNIFAIFSVAIISFLILIPIVNAIRIPLGTNNTGLVSIATIKKISPYTNYLRFLLFLAMPFLVAVIVANKKPDFVTRQWQFIKKVFGFLTDTKFYTVISFILLLSWAINRTYGYLSFPLDDTFHEGEYLGFLPNFLTQTKPFLNTVMIHGFGLNVLTSLIANKLATHSNVIALTRFFRMTQGLLTYLACFWLIWEIISSVKFNIPRRNIFLLFCAVFTFFDGFIFEIAKGIHQGRDVYLLVQLALTVRFFRMSSLNNLSRSEKFILPTLVGISLPLSILYVYDRAIYFILIYLVCCALAIFLDQKFSRDWLIGSGFGIVTSSVALVIILGVDQVLAILSQISYWGRYGRYMTFIPLPSLSLESLPIWRSFTFLSLVIILGCIYLFLEYQKYSNLKELCANNCLIIILLFSSLVYSRIALDRSDYGHVAPGALMSVFLLTLICVNLFKEQIENFKLTLHYWVTLLIISLAILNPFFRPYNAYLNLDAIQKTYQISDTNIIKKDYLDAFNTLKPEIDKLSCFYGLTSEGLWYYLFQKPSCSRFIYVYYAQPQFAQKLVVSELKEKKPGLILFTNDFWSNAVDGIQVSDSASIIYQYFLEKYKPYRVIGSHWFWNQRNKKLTFIKNQGIINNGYIDSVVPEKIKRRHSVPLSGWAVLPKQVRSADAVYISYGSQNKLIAVARVNAARPDVAKVLANDAYTQSGWSVLLPIKTLPTGNNVLRVWSYDAKGEQLQQIGKDINMNLVD